MDASTFRPVFLTFFAAAATAGIASAGFVGQAVGQSSRPELTRGVPLAVICGPQASMTAPSTAMQVVAGIERRKALYAPGDLVVINAGTAQGIQAGQHFYARRVIGDRFAVRTSEAAPHSIHTAGWITVVETGTSQATARVVEACDGLIEGDYLEPFVLPKTADALSGEPDYARPARVVLGDDRRQMGAEGALMVLDRGSDHGMKPGQRLTIFRRAVGDDGPIVKIGDAVVASTQSESSMMRIEKSHEAVQVGDLVAIHR
jgi:hypothetical protein